MDPNTVQHNPEKPKGWGEVPLEPHGLEHFKMLLLPKDDKGSTIGINSDFCRLFKMATLDDPKSKAKIRLIERGDDIGGRTDLLYVCIDFSLGEFKRLHEYDTYYYHDHNSYGFNEMEQIHRRLTVLNNFIQCEGLEWPLAIEFHYCRPGTYYAARGKGTYRITFIDF